MRSTTIWLGVLALLVAGCPRGRTGHGGDGDDDDDAAADEDPGNQNGDPEPADPGAQPGPGNDPGGQEPGPVGDPGPSNGCLALFDCLGLCGDDACANDCIQATPPAGQQAFDAIMTCYQGACAAEPEDQLQVCLEESCPDELMDCR